MARDLPLSLRPVSGSRFSWSEVGPGVAEPKREEDTVDSVTLAFSRAILHAAFQCEGRVFGTVPQAETCSVGRLRGMPKGAAAMALA